MPVTVNRDNGVHGGPENSGQTVLGLLQGRGALIYALFQFGIQKVELCPHPRLGIHLALNGEARPGHEDHPCQRARDGDEAIQTACRVGLLGTLPQ